MHRLMITLMAPLALALSGCAAGGASQAETVIYGPVTVITIAGEGCHVTRGLDRQREGEGEGSGEADVPGQSATGSGRIAGGIVSLFTSSADCTEADEPAVEEAPGS